MTCNLSVDGSRHEATFRPRGGGEDPWLYGPGVGLVCLYRGMCLDSDTLRSGTPPVKIHSLR